MLNIRKAPYTEDVIAQKNKAIHGSRYIHLRGVDPAFDNCSIPIEILIDKVEGSVAFSMLLEDITPLDENKDTLYASFELNNLPPNEPTINYIEDYLDVCEFRDAKGNDTYVKEYFTKRHILLFYSCGSIIDDICYAEELKAELRKDLDIKPKRTYIKEKIKNKNEGYYSAEKNFEDTLDNVITFANDIGTKLKDYYQANKVNKEEIEKVSQRYIEEELEKVQKKEEYYKKMVYDMLKFRLGFKEEMAQWLLYTYPFETIFSGNINCPYNHKEKIDKDCFSLPSWTYFGGKLECGLKCPKFK